RGQPVRAARSGDRRPATRRHDPGADSGAGPVSQRPCHCGDDEHPGRVVSSAAKAVRSVSYGGGVQSTSLLALAAQGRIDFDLFVFANTGADSEHPETLRYVHDVAMPFAAAHGIELLELHRIPKRGIAKGQVETLWGRMTRPGSRSLPIPVRMSGG